jgi:hypothetical protein
MLATVASDELGSVTLPNVVPRLTDTPGEVRHAGRAIGQDTRDVLREVAGLTEAEVAALETAGVISCEPAALPLPAAKAATAATRQRQQTDQT